MPEIVFYCSHERPDVANVSERRNLTNRSAFDMQYAVCRHRVNPDDIEARDERVLAVARFLAEHLTITLRSAKQLKLTGIDNRSEKDRRIFGPLPTIEWDFDMLRFSQTPAQYLRLEAQSIIDLHAREGIVKAELNGAVLDFAQFERETVRARASRLNGKKGGRPQANPDRKMTRMGISIYADQQDRLKGVNLSELVRELLDTHIAKLPNL